MAAAVSHGVGSFSPVGAGPREDNQDARRLQNVVQTYLRDIRIIAAQQASLGNRKDQINAIVALYTTPDTGMSQKEGQDAMKKLAPHFCAVEKTVKTAAALFALIDNAIKEITRTIMPKEARERLTPQELRLDASKRYQAATHDILDYLDLCRAKVASQQTFLLTRAAVFTKDATSAYYTFHPVSGINPLNWFTDTHFRHFLTAQATEAQIAQALTEKCPDPIEPLLTTVPEEISRAFETLGIDPKTLDSKPAAPTGDDLRSDEE